MRHKILFLFCAELLSLAVLSCAASGSQKLKVTYAAITGAYTPLWIAVEDGLGRKYGLDLESIYAGRTNPGLILASGEAQYSVNTGFGTIQTYALGRKDGVIVVSFANTTGFSIYSKPQIINSADLRGKVIGHLRARGFDECVGEICPQKQAEHRSHT